MVDVKRRDELEKKLATQVAKVLGGVNKDFIRILAENGYNIHSPEVTKAYSMLDKDMRGILQPFYNNVATTGALALADDIGIGVDWDLINQNAANWARGYSTILAGQVADTSRQGVADSVRRSIGDYFEEGLTQGELQRRLSSDPKLAKLFTRDVKDKLGRVYGPTRAEMIARTEVTRAAVEGERLAADYYLQKGIKLVEVWETRDDAIVCVICGPRDGQPINSNWTRLSGPPAHPRCRCWVNFVYPKKPRKPKTPEIPEASQIPLQRF